MTYDVTVTRFGNVKIDADSEAEAMNKANNLNASSITWSDDYHATDAQPAEN